MAVYKLQTYNASERLNATILGRLLVRHLIRPV